MKIKRDGIFHIPLKKIYILSFKIKSKNVLDKLILANN